MSINLDLCGYFVLEADCFRLCQMILQLYVFYIRSLHRVSPKDDGLISSKKKI